jgi:hypothetical protein
MSKEKLEIRLGKVKGTPSDKDITKLSRILYKNSSNFIPTGGRTKNIFYFNLPDSIDQQKLYQEITSNGYSIIDVKKQENKGCDLKESFSKTIQSYFSNFGYLMLIEKKLNKENREENSLELITR